MTIAGARGHRAQKEGARKSGGSKKAAGSQETGKEEKAARPARGLEEQSGYPCGAAPMADTAGATAGYSWPDMNLGSIAPVMTPLAKPWSVYRKVPVMDAFSGLLRRISGHA